MAQAIDRLLATPKMIPLFPSSNAMTRSSALELRARPTSQIRCRIVGGLQKLHQRFLGLRRRAHCIVWQDELTQWIAVRRCTRPHARFRKSLRLLIPVGEVHRVEAHAARP